MKKSEALEQWKSLPETPPPGAVLAEMVPIPYRATGSSYGACGIQIDGTSGIRRRRAIAAEGPDRRGEPPRGWNSPGNL